MKKNGILLNEKFIVLLLILYSLSYGCSNTKDKLVFDVIVYNDLISKAENEILNKNLVEANTKYKEVFNDFPKIFSFDLNNALVTSLKIKDWENALIYSSELMMRGCDFNFFEKSIFDDFKSTSQWKVLTDKHKKLRNIYLNNIDKILVDSLNILHSVDQNQYCLIPSGRIELKNAFERTIFIDSLLVKLINSRGFPSEKLIGANIERDTVLSPLPRFFSLLRHSYQANSNMLGRYLEKAVDSGDLKREVYENISSMDDINYAVIDCKIYKNRFNSSNSFKDNLFNKKVIYNNSNMNDGYNFYAPLAILKGTTIKSFGGDFDAFYEYVADYSGCKK